LVFLGGAVGAVEVGVVDSLMLWEWKLMMLYGTLQLLLGAAALIN
jgi:hypothetical protein